MIPGSRLPFIPVGGGCTIPDDQLEPRASDVLEAQLISSILCGWFGYISEANTEVIGALLV